jgi:hypothetical protein
MDFPAGHEVPNITLPFGTEVELVADGTTGWISYKEDALSSSEPVESAEDPSDLSLDSVIEGRAP